MEQITFDHAQESIFRAMGIDQTRGELLLDVLYQNSVRDINANAHINPSELVENGLMLADTPAEQVYVAYVCGQILQKAKCHADQHNCMRINQVLQALSQPELPHPGQN